MTLTLLLGMVASQSPVLIEVPPLPGSTPGARQHYADGHVDDEGPSRADLAKRFGKRAVNFSTADATVEAPAAATSLTSDDTSPSPEKMPPARKKNPPPVKRPKIYMQSHQAATKESESTTIILSSSDDSPTPVRKTRKRPLSIDEETNIQPLHDDNDGKSKDESNIFQSGLIPHRGRGGAMASSRSIRSEKLKTNARKPKAEAKKSKAESKTPKFKSSEFVFNSPSPPPSPPTTSKSTRPRPLPRPIHPISAFSKPPFLEPPSTASPTRHISLDSPARHPPLEHLQAPSSPAAVPSGSIPLARMMQPPPSSNAQPQSIPPSLGQQQQPPLSPIPTQADQAADPPHLHPPSNPVYYEGVNRPHNPGYMGAHAATGFPVQYVNQPVAYHPQQAAHLPLQEGGGMPRHDGQPLPIGGQHIQMGGGGQHPMQMQMGGMPMQWPGGGMYYTPSMAFAGSGYGYPPMVTQQQRPPQQEQLYTTRRPAGDRTPGAHSLPHQG